MSDSKRRALLRELVSDGAIDDELLAHIADAVGTRAPDPSVKQRLFERVRAGGRLHRFADRVAEMLDIDVEGARGLLDGIDRPDNWEESPLPDVRLYHLDGGPKVQGAITGFVRIDSQGVFPEHDHTGPETVLIVQGRCRDTFDGRILGPGDVGRMAPDSGTHEVVALPGPPLVYLAVVFEGIRIGETKFGPDTM
jgi:quercetin dioxygenase-like cupin family protein